MPSFMHAFEAMCFPCVSAFVWAAFFSLRASADADTGDVAVWGSAECTAANPFFRFDLCCYTPDIAVDHLLVQRTCFQDKGPAEAARCCLAVPRSSPDDPVHRFKLTGALSEHPLLQGCMQRGWQDWFAFFRTTRACMACYGRVTVELTAVLPEGCRFGRILESFSWVVAAAMVGDVDLARVTSEQLIRREHWTWEAGAEGGPEALATAAFFSLAGRTPHELVYVMDQVVSAHREPLLPRLLGLPDLQRPPGLEVVFDFGSEGGGDLNYYMRRGLRVLGIDAGAGEIAAIRARLKAEDEGRSWTLLQAAVTGASEQAALAEASPGANGDVTMQDENAKSMALAPETERLTCAGVMGRMPLDAANGNARSYWKIDLDGRDLACLRSLFDAALSPPRVISVEFAFLPGGSCDNALECRRKATYQRGVELDMLQLLWALGYRRFKLVRQWFYNLLATPQTDAWGKHHAPSNPEFMMRFGSGPIADEAVDYITGTSWRSYDDILKEIVFIDLEALAGLPNEWYDLHAELGPS